jgi:NADP-reducing hydrogenase subunit HndB
MGKLTHEGLQKLRGEEKEKFYQRYKEKNSTMILIGMGSCGIAAGAKNTMQTFIEQTEKLGLKNIIIKPTGCMGSCHFEPIVEVIAPDMPDVLYGMVNSDTALKIIDQHLIHKRLVSGHVFDKPSIDIINAEEKENGL